MAVEIIGGAEVRFKGAEERERLGKDFLAWITQVEDDRRQLILETYIKVQENMDGRADVKGFPWYGASNAFAPLTGTYADAFQSRLFDAATAHDPTNLVLPRGEGEIIPGVNYSKWADWWQRISRWAENDDIDHKSLMELVTLTFTHYGDCWVYLPWEEQWIADVEVLKGGKLKTTPRLLYGRPMPKVLHPKDVFVRWDAVDPQLERLIGFQFDLDLATLDEWEARGIYDADVAKELRGKLKGEGELEKPGPAPVFSQLGTPIKEPDEFEAAQKRRMKLDEGSGNRTLKMLKMFARADMDGDGVPEEMIYDVEKETGLVAYARYANYAHRERPLVHYWFKKRPGSIYNIGVGEMMLNIQDIINTALRDHFDNNKIQNTSIFLIRKNSGIKQGKRVYPSATFWVNNPKEDFQALTLGQGSRASSLQEISILERWGQFIIGLSDFQLGQEPKSRTPAATASLSLSQASIRPKRIIEVMRHAMRKQHKQILMLYFQNGKAEDLARVAAVEEEDPALFIQAMDAISDGDMRRALVIDPDVSSDALNRDSRRQEGLALFAQLDGYYQKLLQLVQLMGQAAMQGDPVAKELFLSMARGYERAMKRILDTFEERDQREMLPEGLIKLMEGITSAINPAEAGQAAQQPNPAEAAQSLVAGQGAGAGPVAPAGRPVAGQPRVPSAASAGSGGGQ